ncbi:FIST signal transduction protein [Sulfurimonas sp.]
MKSFNLLFKDEKSLNEFIGFNPAIRSDNVLAQIFSSIVDSDFILNIAKMIKSKLPQVHVIGTTTSGEVCDGKMYDGEIVISFTVFETSTIKSKLYQLDDSFSLRDVYDELISDNTKVMIVFSDGLKSEAEPLLKGLYDLKYEMIIAGGRAADKNYAQTYVFNDVDISDEGCVITTLSGDELLAKSDYILKWTPIGKDMLVTKANGSILYELDDIPIMEIYKKYLGDDVVKNLPESSMSFPLITNKEGLLVARDPLAFTKEGAFIYCWLI